MEEISREQNKTKHLKDMMNLTVYQNPQSLFSLIRSLKVPQQSHRNSDLKERSISIAQQGRSKYYMGVWGCSLAPLHQSATSVPDLPGCGTLSGCSPLGDTLSRPGHGQMCDNKMCLLCSSWLPTSLSFLPAYLLSCTFYS